MLIMTLSEIKFSENTDKLRRLNTTEAMFLKESISENGILSPLIVDEDNQLIDGHNRLAVAQELGMQEVPVFRLATEEENLETIYKLQVGRRNLKPADRDELVCKLYHLYKERGGAKLAPGKTNLAKALADMFDMSLRSVKYAASRKDITEIHPYFESFSTHQINKIKDNYKSLDRQETETLLLQAADKRMSPERIIKSLNIYKNNELDIDEAIDLVLVENGADRGAGSTKPNGEVVSFLKSLFTEAIDRGADRKQFPWWQIEQFLECIS